MCFATAAAIAGIAGAGISAVGSVEGGIAQSNAANYQAQVAANNAKIAQQNATSAIEAGQVKAQDQSLKEAEVGGEIKASQAASGIDVNSGSAVDVQAGQRAKGELDPEMMLHNAQLEAYGYRSQAVGYEAQSELDKTEAAQAPIGADLGAAGSLLSNASGLGFKWTSGGALASAGNQGPELVGSG